MTIKYTGDDWVFNINVKEKKTDADGNVYYEAMDISSYVIKALVKDTADNIIIASQTIAQSTEYPAGEGVTRNTNWAGGELCVINVKAGTDVSVDAGVLEIQFEKDGLSETKMNKQFVIRTGTIA